MNDTEARTFRAAYEAAVKRYSKMPRAALAAEERALMADQGMQHIYGGPVSKDELLTSILNLRGYTIEKLNEATHVVGHDVVWPDCKWCQAEAPCQACIGQECHCDHPAEASPALVPTGTGWPVKA